MRKQALARRLLTGAAVLAVAAGVAACSGAGDKSEGQSGGKSGGKSGENAAQAALPPGRPAIYQAAEQSPEAFVGALYAVYPARFASAVGQDASMGAEQSPEPGQDPIYSRKMNAMIGGDFRAAKGEVPFLNYDPICGCQDGENFKLDSLTITPTAAKQADAAVVFTNAGETTHRTLKLIKEGPMWRVEDVIDDKGRALSTDLLAVMKKAGL